MGSEVSTNRGSPEIRREARDPGTLQQLTLGGFVTLLTAL